MPDNGNRREPLPIDLPSAAVARRGAAEGEEESCPAYGFLWGLHERALALRFVFRSGNSACLSYSLLALWEFNPSAGLLLKFTGGDLVTLVAVHCSNLDALVNGSVNLTDRGLARHRITYVREMDEDELRKVGEGGPHRRRVLRLARAAQGVGETERAGVPRRPGGAGVRGGR
jgi:hypothetical protein